MELKEGMYIRTRYGIKRITEIICGKNIRFDNTYGFDEELLSYHYYDGISKNGNTWEEIVIGEPKEKIIDLIEVGDHINGSKVIKIEEYNNEKYIYVEETEFCNGCNEEENIYYKEDTIKSIVTKEQFKNMEYIVGGINNGNE